MTLVNKFDTENMLTIENSCISTSGSWLEGWVQSFKLRLLLSEFAEDGLGG